MYIAQKSPRCFVLSGEGEEMEKERKLEGVGGVGGAGLLAPLTGWVGCLLRGCSLTPPATPLPLLLLLPHPQASSSLQRTHRAGETKEWRSRGPRTEVNARMVDLKWQHLRNVLTECMGARLGSPAPKPVKS